MCHVNETSLGKDSSGDLRAADPVREAALDWFTRLEGHPSDAALRARFEAWRHEDPRHEAAFSYIAELWGSAEFTAAVGRRASSLAPTTVSKPLRRERRGWQAPGLAAAGIAATLLLLIGGLQLPGLLIRFSADYATAVAERRTVELPDGSRLTLDGASAAAIDFADGHRTVRLLEGEAFFDVVRDPSRPFRAVGRFGAVEVTGTAFSVRLGESEDEVVLARGQVEVRALEGGGTPSRLVPGDMISVGRDGLSAVRKVDPERALAWLDGRLSFSRRPIGDVIEDMRRYYGGRIFIFGSGIAAREVSGSYRLDDPALVVRSLAEAAGATATLLPGGIIILR